ncbi:MAG: FMN-binding protein [Oligoflexia bacterium]|nr:FMN-binding protein [Oligoflexia bacterium]
MLRAKHFLVKNFHIYLILFFFGFFPITSQTILFREFLCSYNGNELGISVFYFSWLFWILIGTLIPKLILKLIQTKHSEKFPISSLLALYIPLFIFQWWLVINIKSFAGIFGHQLFPTDTLIICTLLFNIPLSIFNGIMFPIINSSVTKNLEGQKGQNNFSTTNITWIFEAFGAFAAGILSTSFYLLDLHNFHIFILSSIGLLFAIFLYNFRTKNKIENFIFSISLPLVILIFVFYISSTISSKDFFIYKKNLIASNATFVDSFSNNSGETFTAKMDGKFLVFHNGQLIETIPNDDNKIYQLLMMVMMVNHQAINKKILIIGENASLASELKNNDIYLYSPIDKYYSNISTVSNFKNLNIHIIDKPLTQFLSTTKESFDVVLILSGDPITTLQSNLLSDDFLKILKNHLNNNAIVLTKYTGIENYQDKELIALGRVIYKTFKQNFQNVLIKPGRETILLSSDSFYPTDDALTLSNRLNSINISKNIFFTLFPRDRIDELQKLYNDNNNQHYPYINTKEKPISYSLSLLLLSKYSSTTSQNLNLGKLFDKLVAIDFKLVALNIIIFFIILLIFYFREFHNHQYLKTNSSSHFSSDLFSEKLIIFISGFAAMSLNISLLYYFSANFYSISTYIGLLTATFMFAIAFAPLSFEALKRHYRFNNSATLLLFTQLILAIFSFSISFFIIDVNHPIYFILLTFIVGSLCGILIFIANNLIQNKNKNSFINAIYFTSSDYFGSIIGASITGLFFIPFIGPKSTLIIISLILLTPLPFIFAIIFNNKDNHNQKQPSNLKIFSYFIIWVVLALSISCYQLKKFSQQQQQNSNLLNSLNSKDYVSNISGYGGPINLLLEIDSQGTLLSYKVLEHNESDNYFSKALEWFNSLIGKKILSVDINTVQNIDAITGATISSKALLATAQITAQKSLSSNITKKQNLNLNAQIIYLLIATIISLFLMFNKNIKIRIIFIILNLAIGGIILNIPYSSEQISNLLFINIPSTHLSIVFILGFLIPSLVFIFGNFYCGQMCPLGLLQELLEISLRKPLLKHFKLSSNDFNIDHPNIHHIYKNIKYFFFLFIALTILITQDKNILKLDPLLSIFSLSLPTLLIIIISLSLLLSIFFPRFWCIYFCPSGGFLNIIASIKPLNKLFPKKIYSRCIYTVKNIKQLGCIECNRCWMDSGSTASNKEKFIINTLFHISVLSILLLLLVHIYNLNFQSNKQISTTAVKLHQDLQMRTIDKQKIKILIKENKLSSQKALYWSTH